LKGFKLKILIFAIIFAPLTFSLGVWQVNRANEKIEILENYDTLLLSTPLALDNDHKNWQPVKTSGTFEDFIIYEDNAILDGKAGYKIYHLFKNSDNSYIFIHRGFVERNKIKNNLPEVEVPEGIKNLEGKVLKRTNNAFIQNIQESDSRIIQEFDLSYLKERHSSLKNKEIYEYLFNLQAENEMKFSAIEKPVNMSSSKHIGYAIQWFGLCAALIILTIYAYRRKDG
jgi:cytochrome oxidase assembly protein ShyY1